MLMTLIATEYVMVKLILPLLLFCMKPSASSMVPMMVREAHRVSLLVG